MKKTISISIILCLTLLLIGCAKVVNTEYEEVSVKIVDSYYCASRLQPVKAGKTMTFITYPAIHQITILYKDVKYTINNQSAYSKFKDKIGCSATGMLETRTYDNGKVECDINEIW